jgi:hypothetical protein
MCTVLLPPGGYPIAINKYINTFINLNTTMTCHQKSLMTIYSSGNIQCWRYSDFSSSRIVFIIHIIIVVTLVFCTLCYSFYSCVRCVIILCDNYSLSLPPLLCRSCWKPGEWVTLSGKRADRKWQYLVFRF